MFVIYCPFCDEFKFFICFCPNSTAIAACLRVAPALHSSPPAIFQLSKRSITTQIWQNYFCVIFSFYFLFKMADLMRRLKAVDCISIMRFIQAAFVWLTSVFVAYMIRASYECDDVQFNSVFFLSTDRHTRSGQGRTWSPTLTHKNYFLVFNINKNRHEF